MTKELAILIQDGPSADKEDITKWCQDRVLSKLRVMIIKPSNEMCLLGSNTHQDNTYSPLVDGLPSLVRAWAENHLLTLTSFKRNLLVSTSS